jgi:hypothetical protein
MVALRNSEVEVIIKLAGSDDILPSIVEKWALFVTVRQLGIFNTGYVRTYF